MVGSDVYTHRPPALLQNERKRREEQEKQKKLEVGGWCGVVLLCAILGWSCAVVCTACAQLAAGLCSGGVPGAAGTARRPPHLTRARQLTHPRRRGGGGAAAHTRLLRCLTRVFMLLLTTLSPKLVPGGAQNAPTEVHAPGMHEMCVLYSRVVCPGRLAINIQHL